jgi:hypothetical protein
MSEQMGESEEDFGLDPLFVAYREACPEVEPRANFMPELWQKIEARRNFWSLFTRDARTFITASAALCLLLLVLNLVGVSNTHLFASSYAEALMADHTAEKTYYTEAIPAPAGGEAAQR